MQLNNFIQRLSAVGRGLATIALGLLAIAFIWQGSFFTNTAALASPAPQWVLAADMGNQVKDKVSRDSQGAKNFVEDTAESVKETARKNANRVDEATDGNNFLERKAQRDAGRIQERANEDASRTKGAVESTKSFVKDAVDNIKDTFD